LMVFWLGTRQAFLPGGHRTGAPGKHVIRGRAKYRLLDEKVRVYVAPPIEEIESSPVSYSFIVVFVPNPSPLQLKPYVAIGKRLSTDQERAVFSKFHGVGGITPTHFLRVAREHTYANQNPQSPAARIDRMPAWMNARIQLGLMDDPRRVPAVVGSPSVGEPGGLQNSGKKLGISGEVGAMPPPTRNENQSAKRNVKELEVVSPARPSS